MPDLLFSRRQLLGFGAVLAAPTKAAFQPAVDGNILAHYRSQDGDDFAPALGRALAASDAIFFPARSEGYPMRSLVEHRIGRDTVIDFNGQHLIFDGGRVNIKAPRVGGTRRLATTAPRYATSLHLDRIDGIMPGDILVLTSSVRPAVAWEDAKQDVAAVRAVNPASSAVALEHQLNFAWSPRDPDLNVSIFRPAALALLRPNLLLARADGHTPRFMIYCEGLRDIRVVAPTIRGLRPFDRRNDFTRNGITFYYCIDISITTPTYEAMSYAIGAHGASRNVTESGVTAYYCHHSHTDMGGFASGYRLTGLRDSDSFQAISTHICFNAHAEDFRVLRNTSLNNWRCIGGSLRNGYIQSLAANAEPLPQFQNNDLKPEFRYLNDDSDFSIIDVTFDTPNLFGRAAFAVKFARRVYVEGVTANSRLVTFERGGDVRSVVLGPRNRLGSPASSRPR